MSESSIIDNPGQGQGQDPSQEDEVEQVSSPPPLPPPAEPYSIDLGLGDIIQIIAPSNPAINEQIYLIIYLDEEKIKLINTATTATLVLTMSPKGGFSDESITSIVILNSPEHPGYALQNGLTIGTWISIQFGGDLPTIITGQIIDLEEDMIGIKTYPGDQIFYIDFAYKGIPENIPIETITIRSPPSTKPLDEIVSSDSSGLRPGQAIAQPHEEDIDVQAINIGKLSTVPSISPQLPVEEVQSALKEILIDADSIQFGDELEPIAQVVELPEEQKRYSIEKQSTDLLNELVSEFPNVERTKSVLNNIHIIIERFRQLRDEFSEFDSNGNASMPSHKSDQYKPLASTLMSLNQKLFWILPIAKNIRKFYNIDSARGRSGLTDFTTNDMEENIEEYNTMVQEYYTNKDSFATYMNKMNEYFTPFTTPDTVTTQFIQSNITAVLDNLGDFYSSIVREDKIKRQRFIIQSYNLGLPQLQVKKVKSFGKRVADLTEVVPLTKNDKISVQSFISLPEPVMHFSNISLPDTNILRRANMDRNFVQYWDLLRKNTSITQKTISLEESEKRHPEYTDQDISLFASNFMVFLSDQELDSDEKYRQFIDRLIPNTELLFDIMNKYITGEITLSNYVSILQPFMIYIRDLTYRQYSLIVSMIDQQVLDYKKKYIQSAKEYSSLSVTKYAVKYASSSALYALLKDSKQVDFDTNILELYGLSPENFMQTSSAVGASASLALGASGKSSADLRENVAESIFPKIMFSNDEILYRLICVDNARLYMNTLAILNEDLVTPFDFDELYNQEKDRFEENMKDKHDKNKCKNYVLTKKYTDITDLMQDEGDEVYYDKLYDFTDYPFLKKHENERDNYSPSDFETFLVTRYMKKTKLPMQDARSEIRDMLRGKRQVQDGQYAVLEIDSSDFLPSGAAAAVQSEEENSGTRYEYYIRVNKKWVKDDTIPPTISMYDTAYFCNVKSDCFSINKKCATPDLAEDMMKDEIIKKMYDEFDSRFHESRKQILDSVYKKYNYSFDVISRIRSIQKYNIYKYNDSQYLSGLDVDPTSKKQLSPYAHIFDLILGQTDYVKRQRNIMRFIQKFTRKAIEVSISMTNIVSSEPESPYWLYCKQTDTKLVPSFFETIATVFLNQGDVQTTIDTICAERGSISEDGDAWTDKYSGYVIKNIDLDTEEGFDAAGNKLKTRDVIEKTVGESLIQSLQDAKIPRYSNPDSQMMSGIVTTMAKYLGVDLDAQRTFIVENASRFMHTSFPTEEAYRGTASASASSSKKKPYREFKMLTILMITLSYIIITIQVNIPSIKTRKTFPGCVRSFVGYPLDGDGDYSMLKYIGCIALKISSGIEPWNSLKSIKTVDKFNIQIKKIMDTYVLTSPTVQTKIAEKIEYNKIHVSEELPAEHDIKGWINFLPPLSSIKIPSPVPLSENFKSDLQEEIVKGRPSQLERISAIRSKIIYYSLAIQVMIQKVVSSEKLILTNGANEPFVENACCNTGGSISTIKYFVEHESEIITYDSYVTKLRDIMHDIIELQKSVSLMDPTNTRTVYPKIPDRFTEDTIYLAFITYCKFNTDLPVPEQISHMCHAKPSHKLYDPSEESLRNRIARLKESGEYNYTDENLEALLQVINSENIIPFNFNPSEISYIQQMRDLIDSCQKLSTPDCQEIPEVLTTLLLGAMDTYDVQIEEDNQEIRQLKNYLAESNAAMVGEIIEFISSQKRLDQRTKQKYKQFLSTLAKFRLIGDGVLCPRKDTSTYKGMQYIIHQIRNLIEVFPNIIKNGVNFQKISVSKHWGLSKEHAGDVQNIVKKYYSKLDKFLKDDFDILNGLLSEIQNKTKKWYQFALHTPLFARIIDVIDIIDDDEDIELGFEDSDLLFQRVFELEGESASIPTSKGRKQRQQEEELRQARSRHANASVRVEEKTGKYSIFNDEVVRYLFTHYLLNVLLKYVKLANEPVVQMEEVPGLAENEFESMSVLEARDQQNGIETISQMRVVASENLEVKRHVAELLISYIEIMSNDKNAINVTRKSIKEDITQSKDKEKDTIVRELGEMRIDEREVEHLKKNLRIGDWNVAGTKGLRFYVPETYDQEREQMETEFQREEARAKLENRVRKNDKVTQRMKDIYATEEEEKQYQNDLVEEELMDDFRMQGNDDEYGGEGDDGEYDQRGGGLDD
jgi:hypothetical protein